MENMDNLNWEDFSPTPNDPTELKKIKKSIRKNNWLTVLTSVVLVAALIFGAIQYGIPALERRYWDPATSTYAEHITDLEFTLAAFSELFVYEFNVNDIHITKNGFASYDLNMLCFNEKNRREYNYVTASLIQNELDIPYGFWKYTNVASFDINASDHCLQTLKKLPEYIKVQANITFPEDLSMGQIYNLQNWLFNHNLNNSKYFDMSNRINWVAIRTSENAKRTDLACGLKPFTSTIASNLKGNINDAYPQFTIEQYSGKNFQEHFLSLLKYSRDQVDNGTGILPEYIDSEENYYQTILDYVEENGIYSYGCTITASPEILLDMWEDDTICDIWIQDVWIGF